MLSKVPSLCRRPHLPPTAPFPSVSNPLPSFAQIHEGGRDRARGNLTHCRFSCHASALSTRLGNARLQVLRTYDPDFEAMSLDEAYLDVTPLIRAGGSSDGGGGSSSSSAASCVSPLSIANEIRERVLAATGLTCSAGAAANKLIAKICRFVPCNSCPTLRSDQCAVT